MNILVHNNIFIRSHITPNAKADIWLLHGLGESSLCFREAFEIYKNEPYNLYAPDLPGFGVSPPRDDCQTIPQLVTVLETLISEISKDTPIHLVGHSMSGITATELAFSKEFDHIKSITNIDGSVIIEQSRVNNLIKLTPENSVQEAINLFFDSAQTSLPIMRYIASLNFTNSQMLYNFTQETIKHAGQNNSGARFIDLKIPKIYIYGKQSWTHETVAFLENNAIKTVGIDGGHWPMIDSPKDCYNAILKFIESTQS